uniref:CUB domain-containing protein n=1 Tax=Meloidogyne enterolobii TaxID=390850 RepID=A0A6V7WHT7_MELEN|nr:unnamed protein product [Meloidogyne enterolobii]
MLYYNPVFFLLLLHLLISIIFAESLAAGTTEISENNNDCSCPTEEIFVSNLKEGAFKSPGFPDKYCGFLDCKWYIQPEENTFVQAELVSFETEKIHDTLDVYHTRMNGSKLINLSGERYDNPVEHLYLSSSINGGLYFHFVTDGINHNHSGIYYSFPCPQPFYFATNSPQRLPAFSLRFIDSCIFSINSTQGIKLTINRFNMTSKFGLKVFETESFPKRYLEHQAGQLAKTESVSILITSYDFEDNIVVPYEIEFVAAEKACKCFPNNLIVSRTQPLNLLSPGFPLGYCDNLNCSTQISLENPLNTNDYVESLQIQFNTFRTEIYKDFLRIKVPFGDEDREFLRISNDNEEDGEKGGISYWIGLLLFVLLAIKIQNKQKQLTIIILFQLIILLIMNRLKYLN